MVSFLFLVLIYKVFILKVGFLVGMSLIFLFIKLVFMVKNLFGIIMSLLIIMFLSLIL